MQSENIDEVYQMREYLIEKHKKDEIIDLKEKFLQKQLSFKDFNTKSEAIEKWVQMEKKRLSKEQTDIKKGWNHTTRTIKRTQNDIKFMNKLFGKYGLGKSDAQVDQKHPPFYTHSFEKT